MQRKIIHIDMDAFYASVEQRDNPSLRNKPIVVGGPPEGRGGVVATASYEARKFGIHSAMPSKRAKELCADVLFIKPRFDAYREASGLIRGIFQRYTDIIEPLSLDEAYLDVTQDKLQLGSAIDIAKEIKEAIKKELNLTASAGISVNKFIAKIASGMNKPDGLTFIGPSKVESFIETLKVEDFFGVGKVTAAKMKTLGLHTGADIKKMTETELSGHFGKAGLFYYKIARGIDDRLVQPHRETKSLAAEDTFPYDLSLPDDMVRELSKIATTVYNRLLRYELLGRTVTVKIKYGDFKQITRSRTLAAPVEDLDTLRQTAEALLLSTKPENTKIRLLGISISNFGAAAQEEDGPPPAQLKMF